MLRNWRTTDRVKGNEWPKNLLLDFCLCERMLIQAEAEEEEVEEDEVVEVEEATGEEEEEEEATGAEEEEEEVIGAEEDEGEEEGVAAEAETGEAEGADPREGHQSNDGKDKRKASQLANHLHCSTNSFFLILYLFFICVPARTRTRANNKFNGSSRCVPCFPCGSSGMSEGEGKE